MTSTTDDLKALRTRLHELAHYQHALVLLQWDQDTLMPEGGAEERANTISYLSGKAHQLQVALNKDGLVDRLRQAHQKKTLKSKNEALVREVLRDFDQATKLPEAFVEAFSKLESQSVHAWQKARAKSDFSLFAPYLKNVVSMSREKSKLYDAASETPYDPLLDIYAPGQTSEAVSILFQELKEAIIPLIKEIRARQKVSGSERTLRYGAKFPITDQKDFSKELATLIGFNFSRGAFATAVHPFSMRFHANDARYTARFREGDPYEGIGVTIHEVGHAMYSQGLPQAEFYTPLGESCSIAVHESQSRLWENMIGRSQPFWKFLTPKLKKKFPAGMKGVTAKDMYQHVNVVRPSLIRVESDEVTYHLHIILRFEIEKALIEGSIEVKEVPKIWNQLVHDYLGVSVPDDARGCMQDMHWSFGLIGYFPTYTMGSLWAAQLYEVMTKAIPDIETKVAHGDFTEILTWQRHHIHRHGRRYPDEVLLKKATGQTLGIDAFVRHVEKKYLAR